MTTKVEKSVVVDVPVTTAYNQWTQFEDFPQFMSGVKSVTQLGEDRLQWVAEIAGVKRQWEAEILEQVPDRKVAWAATEGATNAGSVTFEDAGAGKTLVHLHLEYEPEGLVEKVGDKLDVVQKQAEGDLERFKAFIEDEGYATGAWRGAITDTAVGTPSVAHADSSRGDDGKAGVSLKAAAAGAAVVAAAGAAAAMRAKSGDEESTTDVPDVAVADVAVADVAPVPDVTDEPVVVTPVDTAEPVVLDEPVDTPAGSALGDEGSSAPRHRDDGPAL